MDASSGLPLRQVIQGDCLEVMSELPKKSIDILLTDPPYFIPANYYETRTQFKRNFADLSILESFFKKWSIEVDRILKDNGILFMFCDGQSYPLFYFHSYPLFKMVRPLIWDKQTSINGFYWRHQHELILMGLRSDSVAVPTGDGDILQFRAVKVDKRVHPAEKPLELIRALLQKVIRPNVVVLDPFCGSGSTLIEAQRLGVKWIGIEISPDYCEIARKRLEPWMNQTRVDDPFQVEVV